MFVAVPPPFFHGTITCSWARMMRISFSSANKKPGHGRV
jgi:hypothetical protein